MVLVGKITQNDTGLVTIDRLIQNETLANITATIRGSNPNTILLTSDIEIFNTENPPRWYTADSTSNKYSVAAINRKEAEIVCFDAAGNPVTNILNGCLFEL
jgi:hypothetical protein